MRFKKKLFLASVYDKNRLVLDIAANREFPIEIHAVII
jgi:hypothetical protein